MKNNSQRSFIESSFDIIFKMFSVVATTTTFALMGKSYLMLENVFYIFTIAFIGTLLGVFVAFIMYPKFYKKGNILGVISTGLIMTFFYYASADEAYKVYSNNELKTDVQYQVLKQKKDTLSFNPKLQKQGEKAYNEKVLKLKNIKDKASLKVERYEDKKDENINALTTTLKEVKWKNEESKVRNTGNEYTNIVVSYETRGYVIGSLSEVAIAQYAEALKALKSTAKEAKENQINSNELKILKMEVEKLSTDSFLVKIVDIEERIKQREDYVKSKLVLDKSDIIMGLILLGIFIEIFLSSIFFLMDLINGFMDKYNLNTTLHLIEIEEEEAQKDENILMIEHKILNILDDISDYKQTIKSFKEEGGVNEARGQLKNFNQVLIGIVVSTLANNKSSFRETTQKEAQEFMKQDFKNNIPSLSKKVGDKTFYPFGGSVARNFKDVQNALLGFNPKTIDMNQVLQVCKHQMS